MNKRELKRALKAWAIRQLWYQEGAFDTFNALHEIRTERQKERVQEVILQIMKEWD